MSYSEAKEVVKRYNEKLIASQYPVSAMYLFGSMLNGTAHADSDIDIAVISKKVSDDYDQGRFELWRLRRDVDLRIEPHGFSPEDFENDSSSMIREIKMTGERIV